MAASYSHLDATVNEIARIMMRSHHSAANCTIPNMAGTKGYDPDRSRRILRDFIKERELSVLSWCKAAGLAESTLRNFLNGDSESLSERSYVKLARAGSVPVARLRGDYEARRIVPIRSRIGAGEIVYPIDVDGDLGNVEVPFGVDATEAVEVDGDSMRPLYGPRDILYLRPPRQPHELIGRIVAAQVRHGPRVVKQLMRGSRKGRWTLLSINPAHPPIEDVEIETVAAIGAAIYAD